MKHAGSCLCGEVRFEVDGAFDVSPKGVLKVSCPKGVLKVSVLKVSVLKVSGLFFLDDPPARKENRPDTFIALGCQSDSLRTRLWQRLLVAGFRRLIGWSYTVCILT